MGEPEGPSVEEIEAALERVREAAVGFDDLFTAMTTVQRYLLGLTRGLDAEAVARLEPGEATDLLGKLQELVIVLEDLQRFRTPARNITTSVRRPPAPPKSWEEELEDHRQMLAERPLRRETVVRLFRGGSNRRHFPMLADLVEQLDREDALASTLPQLQVAELIAGMRGLGRRKAATVLHHAELPADVRFEDLGAADVQRLSRTLRLTAHGIPRNETGGDYGAKPEDWPQQAGPAEYTEEEKARYDAELRAKDEAELSSAGPQVAEYFLERLEAYMWESYESEQPAELLTQLRDRVTGRAADLDAASVGTALYRWGLEALIPAVRAELGLPLLRADAEPRTIASVAGDAVQHLIREWDGSQGPESEPLLLRVEFLGAVSDAAKQMDQAGRLQPNYPRRRQSSPLRAYERVAEAVARVALYAHALAAETADPVIEQIPDRLAASATGSDADLQRRGGPVG